jgi:hypothetical protein
MRCLDFTLEYRHKARMRWKKLQQKRTEREIDLLEGVRWACNAHVPLIDIAIVGQARREEFGRLFLQLWLSTHWSALTTEKLGKNEEALTKKLSLAPAGRKC